MAELAKTFGRRVRAMRQEQGFSQVELADRIGASEEWVRRMERGEGAPSFKTLEALSTALSATVGELFADPAAPDEHMIQALEGLDDEARAWLVRGARLLRRT